MKDSELDHLLHEVLDGTATAEQRSRLEARLAASPAARARHWELEAVFNRLRGVRSAEAPAGLRESVLRAVAARPSSPIPGWREVARAGFASRVTVRLALPFALGVAVGAIAFAAWTGNLGRTAGDQVTGTMMLAAVRPVELRIGPARVVARGERSGEIQTLRLEAHAVAGGGIELRFDPNLTRLAAVRQLDPRSGEVEVEAGRVRLRPAGDGEVVVELLQPASGAPVILALRSKDGEVSRTLPAGFGTSTDR